MPPVVTIALTANSYNTDLSQFAATARDPNNTDGSTGSGVSAATLFLVRVWDNSNWNGSAWVGSIASLPLTVGAPNGSGTCALTVGTSYPLPSGSNLPAGQYKLSILAPDHANNKTTASVTLFIGQQDVAMPTEALTTPAPNSSVPDISVINGTATNPNTGPAGQISAIYRVAVVLSCSYNGYSQSWNGTAWQSGPPPTGDYCLGTRSNGVVNWSVSSPLPATETNALYTVQVEAFDT